MTTLLHSGINRRQLIKGTGMAAAALSAGTMLSGCGASSKMSVTTWYFPFGSNVEEVYAAFKEEFESEYTDIEIDLQLQPWADRYPKMLTALGANRGPDVMFMTPDALIQFASAGVLEPLDDLIDDDAWQGFPQSAIDSISYDGQRWYFPIDQEVPVWLYNKTLMEKIGLDPGTPPETWADIRTVCEATKASGEDIYGFGYRAAAPSVNDTFYPHLRQAGGQVLSEDLKEATLNSEEGVKALSFIVEMFDKGWSPQSYLQPNENIPSHPFFQGTQVISIQYKPTTGLKNAREVANFDWGMTPTIRDEEAWGFGATRSWAISSNAKDKDAAATWVNFLARPENVQRHCEAFGITPSNPDIAAVTHQDDPEMQILAGRLSETFGELEVQDGRQLMPLLTPEIQLAILGEKTPQQALDTAAEAINQLLV
ncbi:MAG: extracellular solute-binding protein [Arachnia sp.]